MLITDDPILQILALPCWHNLKVSSVVPLMGLSGGSFQIRLENNTLFVARRGGEHAKQLGICRTQEQQVLRYLAIDPHTAYRAPTLFYDSPQWSILTWVIGNICPVDYLQHKQGLQQLATCLQAVHHCTLSLSPMLLKQSVPVFDIKQRLALYWQHTVSSRKTSDLQQLYNAFSVQKPPCLSMPILAHHDLHPANMVLTSTGLALIDWEYAAVNALACEMLFLCDANQFSVEQLHVFLQYYLPDQQIQSLLLEDMAHWRPWCHFLTLLWFEVRFGQTGESQYATWARQYQHTLRHKNLTQIPSIFAR
ncbi:MAG: phosphotransferase [Plesiomonas sp.]|uniref:phosphotransferase n=1 Tax=Plesiomonas sp. TaxID=2486279 RepID=UPI003F37A0A6